MRGLHGSNHLQFSEARNILRGDDLGVFDAISAVARWIHSQQRFERVQRHAIGLVADGVKRQAGNPTRSRSMAMAFNFSGSTVSMPLVDGSSEYGARSAAVCVPRAPSMNPLSAPVLNQGSVVPPSARLFCSSSVESVKGSHSVMRTVSFLSCFRSPIRLKIFPRGKILHGSNAVLRKLLQNQLNSLSAGPRRKDQESVASPSPWHFLSANRSARRRQSGQSLHLGDWAFRW